MTAGGRGRCAPKSSICQGIEMERTISTKDLKSKLDRKEITVVETLAPERYREAHIPGALNIPPERIKELAPQLLPNKNSPIVTYCTSTH
jgi:rhodanese-related sulfurtransferase